MNPAQKSGNSKSRRRRVKNRKGDIRIKRIARMETKKALMKKIESKMTDRWSNAFPIDSSFTTSLFTLTANLTQGSTGRNSYLGQVIEPTHIRIRWAALAADSTNLLRVVVIQDVAGGGVPLVTTLFQNPASVLTPLSPYLIDYNHTYKVLFDEFYSMVLTQESTQLTGDIRIKKDKLRKISFLTGGGSSVATGAIYLIFVSDSNAGTHPIGSFTSRLYFKDA